MGSSFRALDREFCANLSRSKVEKYCKTIGQREHPGAVGADTSKAREEKRREKLEIRNKKLSSHTAVLVIGLHAAPAHSALSSTLRQVRTTPPIFESAVRTTDDRFEQA
jgi:hypothetical protein